jgi:glucokinase
LKRRTFIGIDIGGTNIEIAAVGVSGRLLARESIPSNPERGPKDAFVRVAEALPRLLGKRRALTAAGVGCAGLVDPTRGKLHASPNLPSWRNAPLGRIARRHLGVYTVVDNDANAAAYGEYVCGSGRGTRTFICITLGTGVGGAVVLDGRLLRGRENFAGEIGHMTICETGPRCKCGNRGCLEAYLGSDALLDDAMKRLETKRSRYLSKWVASRTRPFTPKTLAEAAGGGDRIARAVFAEAGSHLGTAMASLINIFNPDAIAVAGGVANSFDLMRADTEKAIRQRAFRESSRAVKVAQAELGTDAAAVGAALLARDSQEYERSTG